MDKIPALKELSAEEKLRLIDELWDDLAAHTDIFPVRDDHLELLRERLEHYQQHPGDVRAWQDVKARILASR